MWGVVLEKKGRKHLLAVFRYSQGAYSYLDNMELTFRWNPSLGCSCSAHETLKVVENPDLGQLDED